MSKYFSWKNSESENCNTALSDKFIHLESSDVLILHQATIILQNRISKTERLQQEFFSTSELSHMIKEKEAAYRLPVGSLWVAYCFTYTLQAAPVGKSCLFVILLAAYMQNRQPVGSSK